MNINEFVGRQNWVFAKTYAKKAPHEYVVRTKVIGTDDEFIEFAKFILETGMTMHFYGHPNKYLYLDGYNYWVMADDMNDRMRNHGILCKEYHRGRSADNTQRDDRRSI